MADYNFRHIKTSEYPAVPEKKLLDESIGRVLPRQISSGATRGTQNIGYGSVKIDGSNNRITVDVSNTNVTIGDISEDNDAAGLGVSDETGTLRLLAGRFADGTVQIALSQPDIDVATANSDQLIWSSSFNMFKIVKTDTATITHTTELEKTTTVFHGLGFVPVTYCFMEIDSGLPSVGVTRFSLPFSQMDTSTGTITRIVDFYVTSQNLYIREKAQTGYNVYNSTNTIRYYFMRETAA